MRAKRILWISLLLAGCAPMEKFSQDKAPEFITARETAFYKHGPQQPGAPVILPPQTFLKVLQRDSGYTFAQLADGRTGYLATEDIRKAPPSARPVADTELFPEKYLPPAPDPDFSVPVDEIPKGSPSKVPR